ncbi:hypothetical protein Q5752_000960 [Cryptotrichosporon argae]
MRPALLVLAAAGICARPLSPPDTRELSSFGPPDHDVQAPVLALGSDTSHASPAPAPLSPSDARYARDGREFGSPVRSQDGWLARWLSLGGEGTVTVLTSDNLTLPHRPAAFPSHLSAPLPVSGRLVPFTALPSMPPRPGVPSAAKRGLRSGGLLGLFAFDGSGAEQTLAFGTGEENEANAVQGHVEADGNQGDGGATRAAALALAQACVPPLARPHRPAALATLALVERGGCDFATKVRAAQDRGARGVIVGDGAARKGETDDEGRHRETLITMFSPEDTSAIDIPSVFVSRASYLTLRDLLDEQHAVWVDVSEGSEDGNALSSLLSFALLMPTLFLLATIGIHRLRVARQREADRAPPLIVFSLPERVWHPDIVWEKDDSDESVRSLRPAGDSGSLGDAGDPAAVDAAPAPSPSPPPQPQPDLSPPLITRSEVRTPPPTSSSGIERTPAAPRDAALLSPDGTAAASSSRRKRRTRSGRSGQRYFSKDECAICMDSFRAGDVVRILPCGHVFHKDECDEWLLKWRKLCPTCRADVTLPPSDMSSSTTLTPVGVSSAATTDAAAHTQPQQPPADASWRDRFTATVRAFRNVVERRARGDTAAATGGGGGGRDAPRAAHERTPLVPREGSV